MLKRIFCLSSSMKLAPDHVPKRLSWLMTHNVSQFGYKRKLLEFGNGTLSPTISQLYPSLSRIKRNKLVFQWVTMHLLYGQYRAPRVATQFNPLRVNPYSPMVSNLLNFCSLCCCALVMPCTSCMIHGSQGCCYQI